MRVYDKEKNTEYCRTYRQDNEKYREYKRIYMQKYYYIQKLRKEKKALEELENNKVDNIETLTNEVEKISI